jgi:ferrochelatase
LAFVTSAYSSYSSCRQYLEDIERARESVGPGAPRVEKLRAFYNHPGFIEANVANADAALEKIPEDKRAAAQIVFTAHSIPKLMAQHCDYEAQLRETSRLIAKAMAAENWRLAFQSRSGSPAQPWLGPDIGDALRELRAEGIQDVVVAPVGFVSDHMEIVYDLDTEAMRLCRDLGMNMVRAATAGTHPAFVEMIRELILERLDSATTRRSLGSDGPRGDVCQPGCCSLG